MMPKKLFTFPVLFMFFLFSHLVLMLLCRIYPFVDLPFHLAGATIVRFYDDPAHLFRSYYELHLLKPNVFYLFFTALPIFPSVEFANHIYYAAYVVLLPVSIWMIIRKIGGSPWYALLAFPALYNLSVHWGFVGYMMALPLSLFIFYVLLNYLERDLIRDGLLLALLFILLFSMHALASVFMLFIFFAVCFFKLEWTTIKLIKKLTVVIPVFLVIIWWWSTETGNEGRDTGAFLQGWLTAFFPQLGLRILGLFVRDHAQLFEGLSGIWAGLLFTIPVFLFLIECILKKDKEGKLYSRPVQIMFWGSLLCSLFLPPRLPDQEWLYHRFTVYVFISALFLLSICDQKTSPFRVRLISLIAVLHLLFYVPYFLQFQIQNENFKEEFFPNASEGGRLTGFIYDRLYRGRPVYIHYPSYYIVWKKGIAATHLIESRFGAIRRKAAVDQLPIYRSWVFESSSLKNLGLEDGIEYVLMRGKIPASHQIYFRHYEALRQSGKWSLFQFSHEENKPAEGRA